MAPAWLPWDISNVAKAPNKKRDAEQRARAIYDRLMALPRDARLSNNDWTKLAGVSTSFFTNLKGNDNKPGSEPTLGNLRAVLKVVGSSLPEFLVEEADGRLVATPSAQALEQAFQDSLSDMPRSPDRRAKYLAEVVISLLELPPDLRAKSDGADHAPEVVPEADAPARAATRRT